MITYLSMAIDTAAGHYAGRAVQKLLSENLMLNRHLPHQKSAVSSLFLSRFASYPLSINSRATSNRHPLAFTYLSIASWLAFPAAPKRDRELDTTIPT